MDARIAAQYGIQASELPALNASIAATSLKLDAITVEANALLAAAALSKTKANQSTLDALNAKRYLTVAAGVASVRKVLSTPSWVNMRGYVNQQFRNTAQVIH